MALYCQTVKILSSFVTPMKGDTIWGHVVWGIAHHEGDEAVKRYLAKADDFIVSSAFPHGYLPRPVLHEMDKTPKDKAEYALQKKRKSERFVPASEFIDDADSPSAGSISGEAIVSVSHNSISRDDGAAIDGLLFSTKEIWRERDVSDSMDIYVETSFSPERIVQLISWAVENGFGADASTGKGQMRIEGSPRLVAPKRKGTHRYMALGPFVADGGEADLLGRVFVRAGKLGGDFAASCSPYKKTVLLFDEGSTFSSMEPIAKVGSLLERMHAMNDHNICVSGFAPVVEV